MEKNTHRTLVIACGAIAHELIALVKLNHWSHITVQCLPANLHNRPNEIPAAVLQVIERSAGQFAETVVAYADCGTGGLLDKALVGTGIARLPGAHCYHFFAGEAVFDQLHEEHPGTLYLTDFLARHFDRLIMSEMGIDQHPELRDMLFANYTRVVYMAQTDNPAYLALAQEAARKLNLEFEVVRTGLIPFDDALSQLPGVGVLPGVIPISSALIEHSTTEH